MKKFNNEFCFKKNYSLEKNCNEIKAIPGKGRIKKMAITNKSNTNSIKENKILLMLMPFWTPLNPPLGISCLKSYLTKHGYDVKTADANIDMELLESYYDYNGALKRHIPEKKRGNFYNTAHKVLKNHSMVYINRSVDKDYIHLVKVIIQQHFFCDISEKAIEELDSILCEYYEKLEKYLIEMINKFEPTIVGISVYTGTLPSSMYAFGIIKERFSNIRTVMGGGVFADELSVDSPNFKSFLDKAQNIDTIIVGEGEIMLLKYLKGELPANQKVFTLSDDAGDLLNLSQANIPDFNDFDIQSYTELSTYISRSCPFQCSFCSETVQWGKYRQKNIKQVVDEITQLHKKYTSQLFLLGDSLLNPFISELAEELIERDLSIYWDGYLRADKNVCALENTMKWRHGGFYRARLGVESGSQNVLDLMDKKITPDQIKRAITCLAKAGIKTTTYWVIGHPGETEEDFQQTLNIIEELKDNIYEAECNPFQYFVSAQVDSDSWAKNYGTNLVFPEGATDMLVTQTWSINTEPSREEIYKRVCRFVEHCRKLGIPNPYSLRDVYLADDRWKKLHKNAVPLITQFKDRNIYINENRNIG